MMLYKFHGLLSSMRPSNGVRVSEPLLVFEQEQSSEIASRHDDRLLKMSN